MSKLGKIRLFFVSALLLLSGVAFGQDLKYDINSAGVSEGGTTLVEISVYAKKVKKVSSELLKKAAVHGIIFRGVNSSGVTGFSGQKALAPITAAQEHGEFFETFFAENGSFLSFADLATPTTRTAKVGKEYRVTAKVIVKTDDLKKVLKDAKVIRGLTDGF